MSAPTASSSSTLTSDDVATILQAPLFRALKNSMQLNQMVEFSRYAQLATINSEGFPAVRTIHPRNGIILAPHHGLGALQFSTDARSAKLHDFGFMCSQRNNSHAVGELAWFFPVSREQYRLRCRISVIFSSPEAAAARLASLPSAERQGLQSLILADEAAQSHHLQFWKDHAPASRMLFELAHPGTHKKRDVKIGDLDRYEPQPIDEAKPSANFVTVLLIPIRGDYLKLPRPEEDMRGQIQKVQHSSHTGGHESTLQPNRQQMRWLHTLDTQTKQWSAVELNP